MASYQKFNAFVANIANGANNLGSDTLKTLLTNTAPVATNSIYSDISATEVANGNGYTTGGSATTISSSTQVSGTYTLIPTAVVVFTASGSVGPFRYAVLYDSSASIKTLIGFWDYGSSVTLASGDTFTVGYQTSSPGILQIS